MEHIPFDSRNLIYKDPFGAVASGTEVAFRVVLKNDINATAVFIEYTPDGKAPVLQEMIKTKATEQTSTYETKLAFEIGLYFYKFKILTDYGEKYILRTNGGKGKISDSGDCWQLTVFNKDFKTPEKLSGGIIYQIFPDRFYNSGKPKNNVPSDRYIKSDFTSLPEHRQQDGALTLGNDYYGGDLEGIRQKLPYIASLGVSIIYLNPIFEAHSNHRYNTADYMKIDSLLGNEKDLKRLCRDAKKHGITIVLDGVFSHTGDDSVYFNRYKRYGNGGAYNSPYSEFCDWFKFKNWPDDYEAWWGVPSLPEVNEDNDSFTEFITGKNGVLEHWLKCGIGGYRLDVADELPDQFLDKLRKTVKEKNKDAIIIGEVWEDATNKISYNARRRYLLGDQLDSVMNYPFSDAIIDFTISGNAEELLETVMSICENYPKKCLDILMNHIGTHDTKRVLTALGGEAENGRNRDWQASKRMSEQEFSLAKKRLYLAALLQYTLPGIPSLYYGDEAGMEGYGDPFCRAFYPWGNQDAYLLDFYRKLGAIRRNNKVFEDGLFVPVFAEKGTFCFERTKEDEKVLICVNRWCDPVFIDAPKGYDNAEVIFGALPVDNKLKIDGLGFTVLKTKGSHK